MVDDFIFELGCEELPSGSVWPLADKLVNHVLASLDKAQLNYGTVKRFATPRRIAFIIQDLQAAQKNQNTIRRGPALAAAYDAEGNPTPALLGFAKSCGVDVDHLTRQSTEKGEWIIHEMHSKGQRVVDLLPSLLSQALAALPIPKPMRWGAGSDEFARPVHWAVMMYGDEAISCTLLGVEAGRSSYGHRFHHPQAIEIVSAESYEKQMKDAFVIVDFSLRKQIIQQQIEELAHAHQAQAIMPEALLNEVTSIVEWPQALIAHFEARFLNVPSEALIASMQSHQKCFALRDEQGKLMPYFITIANIASSNPKRVIQGNEKVMRARLSDAEFFYEQDRRQPLSAQLKSTEKVVFQIKLGSLRDKSLRILALINYLSPIFEMPLNLAQRAAELSKCDLLTGMVGEFPELQGLMGHYYALHDGEDPAVARALNEQYMPRFAADALPQSRLGLALSLADRMDTLVGIFAIGQKPSGVKDPFKLRRHALAVVRLLIQAQIPMGLSDLIQQAIQEYKKTLSINDKLNSELKTFILERLPSYYQEQNVTGDLIQAVKARQDESLPDLDKRLKALQHFITLPEAASLSAACKRVNNLLNHAGHQNISSIIQEQLLEEGAEKNLYLRLKQLLLEIEPLYLMADYKTVLQKLASVKEEIDIYFDQVMILVDNEELRVNRLALLKHLQQLLQGVADISLLQ